MLTSRDIRRIAREQSALELGCSPDDFLRTDPVLVPARSAPGARAYYHGPIACNLVSYGQNVVVSAADEVQAIVWDYVRRYEFFHCFETPNLHVLNEGLRAHGQQVCFMAEYFLPEPSRLSALPCPLPLRLMGPEDFAPLYGVKWHNALCEDRKHLDVLGIGAWDGDALVGLAACSADCERMWQIGVDVLPEYRGRGIAPALVSRLAQEILLRDRVPFYCCAWSNIRSAKAAMRAGFEPAWAELTAKPSAYVEEMNR